MAIDLKGNIFEQLGAHVGHKIECVEYGDGQNRAIECATCHTVLIDDDGIKGEAAEAAQEDALVLAKECLLIRADQWREMAEIQLVDHEEMFESSKEECLTMSKMYRDAYVSLAGGKESTANTEGTEVRAL